MPIQTLFGPQQANQAQKISFTSGAATLSNPFPTATGLDFISTVNCRIAIGDATTVVNSNGYLILAGDVIRLGCKKGNYVSVIGDVSLGTLEIYPVNVPM